MNENKEINIKPGIYGRSGSNKKINDNKFYNFKNMKK